MTTTIRARFLEALADDEHTRTREQLVEDLRMAACLLDGTTDDLGEPLRTAVAHRTARRLREAAQRLCDHTRTDADERCRYC